MHPAKSVVFFTTASGAGYGLLALTILFALLGLIPTTPLIGLVLFGIAYALITGGLLSSTAHLGHPERAWRAMSQWRSSWLSREGLAAIFTYAPTGLFALIWLFGGDVTGPAGLALGAVGIAACAVTVFTTSMIYASLKTIHAWCNIYVPIGYQAYAAATGGVILAAIAHLMGFAGTAIDAVALIAVIAGLGVKLAYWRFIDETQSKSTVETATGLGTRAGIEGKVRLLEAPHSQANYLMTEMGFKIARKHAAALRRVALLLAFFAPALLIALSLALPGLAPAAIPAAAVAAVIGMSVERWLFFAEAKHTVMLYYGAQTA